MNLGLKILLIVAITLIPLTILDAHAEYCHYVARYAPCIDSKYFDPPYNVSTLSGIDSDFTLAELNWKEASFPIKNGTGFVTIILKDPDLNNDVDYKEKANVFVYSDSDPEIHIIELQETESDSGIFERKFGISDSRSAPNVIFTQDGDTIGAMYVDSTMPPGHFSSENSLLSTAIIGSTGPPLERVPASNPRIMDLDGNVNNFPVVGEQAILVSDILNQEDHEQKFAWIAQITDEQNRVMSLSWIDGTINPDLSFSPSTSWIPQKEGNYVVVFFVWESVTNPTALSPPIELEFTVLEKPLESDFSQIKGHVTSENVDKRLEATKRFFDSNTFDHATILHTDIDYLSKHVVVTISDDDFTNSNAEYYEEKLEEWIPFETRILVASIGQPE